MRVRIKADRGRRTAWLCLPFLATGMLAGCAVPSGDADVWPDSPFRECAECPELVVVPAGEFLMGTAEADRLTDPRTGKPALNDSPQHMVTIPADFAIGRFEVSTAEFGAFIAATGYEPVGPCMEFSAPDSFTIDPETNWIDTGFPQSEQYPVSCVSYFDAVAYANWLSATTGYNYRLPSEAEWEYAARAGSTAPYYWGRSETDACTYANVRSAGADSISKRQSESDVADGLPCDDGFPHSSPVGSFVANDFGLYDMQGNVWEWMADCNHKDYEGAPADGSAWIDAEGCQFGVIRSGSFLNRVERSSTTVRAGRPREGRATNMGFRVVRDARRGESYADGTVAQAEWTASSAASDTAGLTGGAALYADNCAACHVRRDDFRGIYGTSRAAVEKVISDGGNNIMSMPAFRDTLSNEQIVELAAYVRALNEWSD